MTCVFVLPNIGKGKVWMGRAKEIRFALETLCIAM